MSFIDQVQIKLIAGSGGKGAVHFCKSRFMPRGGPDGGDGGNGGDVILSPDGSLCDLSHLTNTVYKAQNGSPGKEAKKKGAKGKNLYITVPPNTLCYDIKPSNKKIFLKELMANNWCVLKGAIGGKGNAFFKKAYCQAPTTFQLGMRSTKKNLFLEVKWKSHVGVIGKRAVGKSSFLQKIINPSCSLSTFTLYPKLFCFNTGSDFLSNEVNTKLNKVVFVDLPGLSTHTKKFLKQIERTKIICFMLSLISKNPYEDYLFLKKELKNYDYQQKCCLSKKPEIVILTTKNEYKKHISIEKTKQQVKLFNKQSPPLIINLDEPINKTHQFWKTLNSIFKGMTDAL